MQTYNSFNELAAAQTASPLQSQMSVFNGATLAEIEDMIKKSIDAWNQGKRKEANKCRTKAAELWRALSSEDKDTLVHQDSYGVFFILSK